MADDKSLQNEARENIALETEMKAALLNLEAAAWRGHGPTVDNRRKQYLDAAERYADAKVNMIVKAKLNNGAM